jgi:hypothetical protein
VINDETFIQLLLNSVSNIVDSTLESFQSISVTGPTFRQRDNNFNLSYNIYPAGLIIDSCYDSLLVILEEYFLHLSKEGEVITYSTTSGSIFDQGKEYFKVLSANIFECYVYNPESFVFARLLKEYDILKKNIWISIDIDGIEKSAWFEE